MRIKYKSWSSLNHFRYLTTTPIMSILTAKEVYVLSLKHFCIVVFSLDGRESTVLWFPSISLCYTSVLIQLSNYHHWWTWRSWYTGVYKIWWSNKDNDTVPPTRGLVLTCELNLVAQYLIKILLFNYVVCFITHVYDVMITSFIWRSRKRNRVINLLLR